MKFCCENMEIKALESKTSTELSWKSIEFDIVTRSFAIYFYMMDISTLVIAHCPFCGAKLPNHLIDERWNTILDELGPEYLPDDDGNPPKKELPPEFQTDEWWKKRGL
jgi:hypothetical protein